MFLHPCRLLNALHENNLYQKNTKMHFYRKSVYMKNNNKVLNLKFRLQKYTIGYCLKYNTFMDFQGYILGISIISLRPPPSPTFEIHFFPGV